MPSILINPAKTIKSGFICTKLSSKLDAGPLIAQGIIKIKGNETLDELTERIHKVEHLLLPEIINLIINKKVTLENEIVKFNPSNQNDEKFIIKNYAF